MEDSIFIKVLEHGEQVGLDGTNETLLRDYIQRKTSINFEDEDHKHKTDSLHRLFLSCFEFFDNGKAGKNNILKTEYYFRLIEYRELQESRLAARSANKSAMWAISISIFAIIISAVLTFAQLNTPVSMNTSDLLSLTNSNAVQREVKLDSLQMAQILLAVGYGQAKPTSDRKVSPDQSHGKEVQHHQLINQYFEDESDAILKE